VLQVLPQYILLNPVQHSQITYPPTLEGRSPAPVRSQANLILNSLM